MKNPIDNLNKLFESRIKLGIMSSLMVRRDASFNDLKNLLEITDGNLASHLRALEDHGYIRSDKRFTSGKNNTFYIITKEGDKSFRDHLKALEQIIGGLK